MRLLNTTTYGLQEFNFDELGFKIPFGYAILSHRWRDDEVSFKDLREKRRTTGTGYSKVVKCCQFAKSRGFSWVWIDTWCAFFHMIRQTPPIRANHISSCIDKRSSSELSEALNSMFRWYTSARECYAFLDDVTLHPNDVDLLQVLRRSDWFTRGWTLQELIAPKAVVFVSAEWTVIGRKSRKATDDMRRGNRGAQSYSVRGDWRSDQWYPETMLAALHTLTRIPRDVLLDQRSHLHLQSVAEKMSWVGSRRTTRIEDQAYCVLGLFYITLAPLYGEGLRAFDRLQAKIMERVSDETIFAWNLGSSESWRVLAQRPEHFSQSAGIRQAIHFQRKPYAITNQGLRFEIRPSKGIVENVVNGGRTLEIKLNCTASDPSSEHLCSMYLEQVPCGHFVRRRAWQEAATVVSSGADRKRPHGNSSECTARDQSAEEDGSEVIFIHMGQEHHTACRLSSGSLEVGRKRPRMLTSSVV